MNRRKVTGWAVVGLALVSAGVLGAIRDYGYGGDLIWIRDYQQAMRDARSSNRPVLISFHSSESDWCRKMEAETFTDPKVVALSHEYVCVRIDTQKEPEIVHQFHVYSFPETLITNNKGATLQRIDGFASAEQIASALKQGIQALQR